MEIGEGKGIEGGKGKGRKGTGEGNYGNGREGESKACILISGPWQLYM